MKPNDPNPYDKSNWQGEETDPLPIAENAPFGGYGRWIAIILLTITLLLVLGVIIAIKG